MTRVIVHAGFHKTGTTSLQKYLAQNRSTFAPYFDYYGQNEFQNAGAHARIYAQKPFIWRRSKFRRSFAKFLRGIPDADVIVLSRETFSGNMPGHRDWRGRPIQNFRKSAIPLCRDIADALRRRFGRDVQVEYLFTTRDADAWLSSVYGHLVRSIHLTEDYDAFRALFPRKLDLQDEAESIAKALRPMAVHTVKLEDVADCHEGPAAAVLDLVNLPQVLRNTLPAAEPENLRQDAKIEAEMMALNRSGLSKERMKSKKEHLLRRTRE